MRYCLNRAHQILWFQVLSLLLQFSRGLSRFLRHAIKGKSLDSLKFNESMREETGLAWPTFQFCLLKAKKPSWPSTQIESTSFKINLRAFSLMFYIRLTSNSIIVLPASSLFSSLPSFPPPHAQLTHVPSRVTDSSEWHTVFLTAQHSHFIRARVGLLSAFTVTATTLVLLKKNFFAFHFSWKFASNVKILLPNVSFCSSRHLLCSSFPCWSEVWSCWVFSSTVSATNVRCFTFSWRHSFSLWDFANLWFNLGISEEGKKKSDRLLSNLSSSLKLLHLIYNLGTSAFCKPSLGMGQCKPHTLITLLLRM